MSCLVLSLQEDINNPIEIGLESASIVDAINAEIEFHKVHDVLNHLGEIDSASNYPNQIDNGSSSNIITPPTIESTNMSDNNNLIELPELNSNLPSTIINYNSQSALIPTSNSSININNSNANSNDEVPVDDDITDSDIEVDSEFSFDLYQPTSIASNIISTDVSEADEEDEEEHKNQVIINNNNDGSESESASVRGSDDGKQNSTNGTAALNLQTNPNSNPNLSSISHPLSVVSSLLPTAVVSSNVITRRSTRIRRAKSILGK